MFGRHPYHRSPWVDVAAVVFVLALFLAPLGYLALEMMGGSGGFGGGGRVVASGGGSAYVAPGSGSSFSAWTQRRGRDAGNSLGGAGRFGGTSAAHGDEAVPFSTSWRERATPDLSVGGSSPGVPFSERSERSPTWGEETPGGRLSLLGLARSAEGTSRRGPAVERRGGTRRSALRSGRGRSVTSWGR